MKKILITGAGSYIGQAFERYIADRYADGYRVDTIDMIDPSWRKKSFAGYDSVFHVAGIAHADIGRLSQVEKDLYYQVNTELTAETARKAKGDGVKQFVFMSSIIVYGESAPIGRTRVITRETIPSPANFYGDSKLQAEKKILLLQDDSFHVVILRPPMVYGRGSKGNYLTLSKMARKLPVFPYVKNERSMLYVENLCEFVRLMIERSEQGIFYPQNGVRSNTSELVAMIGRAHGKKIRLVRGFGWALKLLGHMSGMVNKAFGSLCYAPELSEYKENYRMVDLERSIELTECDL